MSNLASRSALTKLRARHAAIFDFPADGKVDPWLEALELAQYRVEALKQLSAECGPSVRQSVSAALSALARAKSERQPGQSKPSRPAKARASSVEG